MNRIGSEFNGLHNDFLLSLTFLNADKKFGHADPSISLGYVRSQPLVFAAPFGKMPRDKTCVVRSLW